MTLNDLTRRNSSINVAPLDDGKFFDADRKPHRPYVMVGVWLARRNSQDRNRPYLHTPRPVMTFANQNTDDRNEMHRSLRSDSHCSPHRRVRARNARVRTPVRVHEIVRVYGALRLTARGSWTTSPR